LPKYQEEIKERLYQLRGQLLKSPFLYAVSS
jgi:hypothetical protein